MAYLMESEDDPQWEVGVVENLEKHVHVQSMVEDMEEAVELHQIHHDG